MQCIEKLHSFLPCDAVHSADCRKMFVSPSVCPSVCLTDTRRYSVKTTKHIIKVFHHRVATPFLFCRIKRYGNITTGTALTGAPNAGSMKNRDFRKISRLISETIQDRAIVKWQADSKSYMSIERRHIQWPWVTSNPDFTVTPLFNVDYVRNGRRYRYSYNEVLMRTYAVVKVSFRMTLNDLE